MRENRDFVVPVNILIPFARAPFSWAASWFLQKNLGFVFHQTFTLAKEQQCQTSSNNYWLLPFAEYATQGKVLDLGDIPDGRYTPLKGDIIITTQVQGAKNKCNDNGIIQVYGGISILYTSALEYPGLQMIDWVSVMVSVTVLHRINFKTTRETL